MPEKKPHATPSPSQPASAPAEAPTQKIAPLGDFVRVLESLPNSEKADR